MVTVLAVGRLVPVGRVIVWLYESYESQQLIMFCLLSIRGAPARIMGTDTGIGGSGVNRNCKAAAQHSLEEQS